MAGEEDTFEFYKDAAGEWRWCRTAPNGNIVGASSEGYKNKSDCEANAERHGYLKKGVFSMGKFMALTGKQVKAAQEALEKDMADDPGLPWYRASTKGTQ